MDHATSHSLKSCPGSCPVNGRRSRQNNRSSIAFGARASRVSLRGRDQLRRLNPEQVRWLESGEMSPGIDAHSFRGEKLVNTVTEVRSRRPVTILLDNRKETVKHFLRNIPAETKARVREVSIDMESMLLAAVEEGLPQASVVVDHFHLIQDANLRVDEARRIEPDAVKQERSRKIFLVGKEKLAPNG